MRIGIDVQPLLHERSGVGQYVYNLVDALGAIDPKNEYILFYGMSQRWSGTLLHPFPYKNVSPKGFGWPTRLLKLVAWIGGWRVFTFDRFIGSVDVFHWPNYLLLPRRSGGQIITVHDLTFLLFPGYHPRIRVEHFARGIRRCAMQADAIIVPSLHTKRDVVNCLGVPEEKVRVICEAPSRRFRPVGAEDGRPTLARYGLPYGGYLLFVGNIEPRKNLLRLLEAYALLRRRWGYPHPLILAGGRGWRNAAIYRAVDLLGLGGVVRFLGYVPDEDLPPLMSGAALFVYPSLYEGFGLPPLEAMACAVPVVASKAASLPEVLGDAALLVDPYDVEGLAQVMRQVLSDDALRGELRRRAVERAKGFSWETTARETLEVYREVHGGEGFIEGRHRP